MTPFTPELAISASGFVATPYIKIVSVPTSAIRCEHCARTVFELKGNIISVIHRHDGQYHKTTVSLEELGLKWAV